MRTQHSSKKENTKRSGSAQPALTPLTTAEGRRLPKPHIGVEAFAEPPPEVARDDAGDRRLHGAGDAARGGGTAARAHRRHAAAQVVERVDADDAHLRSRE